jgi:hypothetical protein
MDFIVKDVQPAMMYFADKPEPNLPMLMNCLLDTIEHEEEVAKVRGGRV